MFFIILASDMPGGLELRLKHRQIHIDYWAGVSGAVKLAGAMLSDDKGEATPKGSAFILEAENLLEVQALLAADPFTVKGLFRDDVRIEVLRPAIGEWKP